MSSFVSGSVQRLNGPRKTAACGTAKRTKYTTEVTGNSKQCESECKSSNLVVCVLPFNLPADSVMLHRLPIVTRLLLFNQPAVYSASQKNPSLRFPDIFPK